MHIQENNTPLTTCTKMTEEVDRRHGMNGNSSSNGVSDDSPAQGGVSGASSGGRLKFFKDGKFILELARAPPGERTGWVSVPRKTFWPPPPGAPAAPCLPPTPAQPTTPRQERATSLSVSDDNSSVQSSPWQRDHCWKQASPRRGVSRGLCMLYVRPAGLPLSLLGSQAARLKRRRPHDPHLPTLTNGTPTNGNLSPDHSPVDAVDGRINAKPEPEPRRHADKPTGIGKFKFFKSMATENDNIVRLRVHKKCNKKMKRKELSKIVDMLKEKLPSQPVNNKVSALNCKQEHNMMVSPRKRILRELERVTLAEDLASKRSRAKQPSQTSPAIPQAGPSHAADVKLYNGTASNHSPHSTPRRDPPVSKPVSSYSINSILSIPEDTRCSPEGAGKKPHTYYKTESVGIHSPDPSPEHYRRTPTVWPQSPPAYVAYPGPSGRSPRPPEAKPKYYYPDPYRSEETALALQNYSLYPAAPYLAHGPFITGYSPYSPRMPPLWMPLPSQWAPITHPLPTEQPPRDDSSDLPLNLSKH